MRQSTVLVLVLLLLVGIGAALLLLGPGLPDSGPGDGEASDAAERGDTRTEDTPPDAAGDASRDERPPVLFGRPRTERVGQGDVLGRVAAASDRAPLAGARILVTGNAHDGTTVNVRGLSGADGTFRLSAVPAGDAFAIRVEATGHPGRTLPGVAVPAAGIVDVGTVWLGAPGALAGRVLDASGRGIAAADVLVHVGSASLGDLLDDFATLLTTLDREPEPLARTTTDNDGAFAFEGLDPGPVVIVARRAGYGQALLPTAVTSGASSARPLVLRLADGETIAGRVLDERGEGIGWARLAVLSTGNLHGFFHGRSFAETDRDGRFRIDTVGGSGRTSLVVSASGFATSMHPATPGDENVEIELRRGATLALRFLSEPGGKPLEGAEVWLEVGAADATVGDQSFAAGTTDGSGEIEVETGSGLLRRVQVTHASCGTRSWAGGRPGGGLQGPEDPTVHSGRQDVVFHVVPGLVLTGRVTAPDGSPVGGARIRSFGGTGFGPPAYTEADGRYRLHTAGMGDAGLAILIVQASGYVQTRDSTMVDTGKVRVGEVTHDVELVAAGVVSGHVLGPDGAGVAGALVRVETGSKSTSSLQETFSPVQTYTGVDGTYLLDGVTPSDQVRVLVRHPGLVDAASDRFALPAGSAVEGVDVRMSAGHALEVRVRGPAGEQVPGAQVKITWKRADDLTTRVFAGAPDPALRRTNQDGVLRRAPVPDGLVTIAVSHPAYASVGVEVEVTLDSPEVVEVDVTLVAPTTLTGSVVDGEGRPVGGAKVSARPVGAQSSYAFASATADAQGRFRLEGLHPGANRLEVRARGFETNARDVQAPAEDLEIRLLAPRLDDEARKQALQKRIAEIAMSLGELSNEERTTRIKEMLELQKELAELQGKAGR